MYGMGSSVSLTWDTPVSDGKPPAYPVGLSVRPPVCHHATYRPGQSWDCEVLGLRGSVSSHRHTIYCKCVNVSVCKPLLLITELIILINALNWFFTDVSGAVIYMDILAGTDSRRIFCIFFHNRNFFLQHCKSDGWYWCLVNAASVVPVLN